MILGEEHSSRQQRHARRQPAGGTARDALSAYFQNTIDIHQYRRIVILHDESALQPERHGNGKHPEFYTGAPVDPGDLRFCGAFVAELWRTLRTAHLVLTAPRRTGKTSVMDYLRDHPENGFSVVSINVQDLAHPTDFFQVLLDGFHDAHPDFVRDQLAGGLGACQRRTEIVVEEVPCLNRPSIRTSACIDPA